MLQNRDAKKEAQERHAFYKSIEESKNNVVKESDDYSNYLETQKRAHDRNNINHEYAKFLDSIDKTLLSEAVTHVFERSRAIQYTIRKESLKNGKDMIKRYFENCNIIDLERHMKDENTFILNNLLEAVETTRKKILNHVDRMNEETFNISKEDINDFYDNLDMETYEDAAQEIRTRVSMATQSFVEANKKDKDDITELMTTVKDNLDSIKAGSQEESAAITSEINASYKRKLGTINDRKKSLFEHMIYANYENIVKNEVLKESFTDDDKMDVDAIIEFTEIQYTVLECINTLKIEPMTSESIKEILS